MRISLSWLREFVDLPESPDELRPILDDLGLVVEGVEYVGEGLEDVLVARVDEIRAIEGADRIRLVVVEAGSGPLEIVCGADNFAVGDYVPLAPVGAVLPGGFAITERTLRGVTSRGMLCSPSELRMSDDHRGLLVLDESVAPRVGESLLEALAITPDVIFDISVEGIGQTPGASKAWRAISPRGSGARCARRRWRRPRWASRVTPSPTRASTPPICAAA